MLDLLHDVVNWAFSAAATDGQAVELASRIFPLLNLIKTGEVKTDAQDEADGLAELTMD